ncbi:hypothetical protein FOL47_005740 [Perkinsus chesapeaki]|uniref:PUB domain-containing protein n=1 Tax=Perkinsus chesapeaki TaxID=330153 RepID=A0A7J6LVV6_PERCH|nr:hypothetical protein FOL47_005740 [Perkinsus chesapeaki]
MTEFKKAEGIFDKLLESHETLVNNHMPRGRDELPTKEDLQQYNEFESLLQECGNYILKFKKRILDGDKNPDNAVYGPKMKAKVEGLIEKYEEVYDQYEDIIQPVFEHAALQEKDRKRREDERQKQYKKDAIESDIEQRAKWAADFDKARSEAERAQEEKDAADKEKAEAQDAELMAQRKAEEDKIRSMDEDTKVCTAIKEMLSTNNMTVAEFRIHLQKLCEYITAIASTPEDEQLRTIRLANQSFNDNIGCLPGAVLLLRGIGFNPTIDSSSDLIRFIKLPEPNAVKDYDYWNKWQKRLQDYADFIALFESKMPTSFDGQRLRVNECGVTSDDIISLYHNSGITTTKTQGEQQQQQH